MNALCHFNTIRPIYPICIYYQICNHTTCYSSLSTITQISSLEKITISSPMAHTHNYIPYNCDIMLTPQAYALTYLFPLNSSHSFQPISYTPHMDVFGLIHTNPGLILTVPKQNSGLSMGSPLTLHRFHFVGPNSMPISGLILTKTQFITDLDQMVYTNL